MSGAEVPRPVYFDANVFIRLVEGEIGDVEPIDTLLHGLLRRGIALWTSELTLAEVLGKASTSDAFRKQYTDLLLLSGICSLVPVSREILLATSGLRREHAFKLADAIHVASAMQVGCGTFMSADKRLRQLPDELALVPPHANALRTFLSALDA